MIDLNPSFIEELGLTEALIKKHRDNKQEGRKRYCRDYNRPEGCIRNSPHAIWIGTGPNATKKTVHHYCATCIVQDRVARDHPEGHAECPRRA